MPYDHDFVLRMMQKSLQNQVDRVTASSFTAVVSYDRDGQAPLGL